MCDLRLDLEVSLDRFWSHVQRGDASACWIWTGAYSPRGYGKTFAFGRHWRAHRLSWVIHNGRVPPGMVICHSCDNPPCVNPYHLFIATQQGNVLDAVAKGRWNTRRGPSHPNAKLTEEQATEIVKRYRGGGLSQKNLASQYGVSQMVVSRIVRGLGYAGYSG